MDKKGFFPFNKRTLMFIGLVLLLAVTMFTPQVFDATTKVGTSLQFVFVNIILFTAPFLALMDAIFRKGGRSNKSDHSDSATR